MDMQSEEFVQALRVIEAFAIELLERTDDGEDFMLMKPIPGGSVVIEVNRSMYTGNPGLN